MRSCLVVVCISVAIIFVHC